MRIGPPAPPAAERPAQGPVAHPAQPFKAVLDAAVGEQRQQAFGFMELGMFGRSAALRAPAEPAPRPAPTAGAAPVEGAADESRVPAGIARAGLLIASATGSAEAPFPSERPRGGTVRHLQAPDPRGGVDAAAEAGAAIDRGEEEAPAVGEGASEPLDRAALDRRLEAARARGVRLGVILHEQDGLVQVTASASALEPEARLRLRGEVARLLAEFGLRLGDFNFNGRPLASAPFSTGNGIYGTRTD